jgi:hypothetical protein
MAGCVLSFSFSGCSISVAGICSGDGEILLCTGDFRARFLQGDGAESSCSDSELDDEDDVLEGLGDFFL